MKTKLVSIFMLVAFSAAACGGAAAPNTPATLPPAPTSTPTAAPTEPSAAPQPSGGLSTRPESAKWNNAPQAALEARQLLVDQLKVDVDTIGLVSVEQVDWPDACLGIQQPGIACAQIIVTGYKIVLSAGGTEYEFHTDETGQTIKQAKP